MTIWSEWIWDDEELERQPPENRHWQFNNKFIHDDDWVLANTGFNKDDLLDNIRFIPLDSNRLFVLSSFRQSIAGGGGGTWHFVHVAHIEYNALGQESIQSNEVFSWKSSASGLDPTIPYTWGWDYDNHLYRVNDDTVCFVWASASGVSTYPYATIFTLDGDDITWSSDIQLYSDDTRCVISQGYILDERYLVQTYQENSANPNPGGIVIVDTESESVSASIHYPQSVSFGHLVPTNTSGSEFVVAYSDGPGNYESASGEYNPSLRKYSINSTQTTITLEDEVWLPIDEILLEIDTNLGSKYLNVNYRELLWYGPTDLWPFYNDNQTISVYMSLYLSNNDEKWTEIAIIKLTFDILTLSWQGDIEVVTEPVESWIHPHHEWKVNTGSGTVYPGVVEDRILQATFPGLYVGNDYSPQFSNHWTAWTTNLIDSTGPNLPPRLNFDDILPALYTGSWAEQYVWFQGLTAILPGKTLVSSMEIDNIGLETNEHTTALVFASLNPVEDELIQPVDVVKHGYYVNSMNINYDGGLSSNLMIGKSSPYIAQVEKPVPEFGWIHGGYWCASWAFNYSEYVPYASSPDFDTYIPSKNELIIMNLTAADRIGIDPPRFEFVSSGPVLHSTRTGITSDGGGTVYNKAQVCSWLGDGVRTVAEAIRITAGGNQTNGSFGHCEALRLGLYNLDAGGLFEPEIKQIGVDYKYNDGGVDEVITTLSNVKSYNLIAASMSSLATNSDFRLVELSGSWFRLAGSRKNNIVVSKPVPHSPTIKWEADTPSENNFESVNSLMVEVGFKGY